jgi:predicted transcriptional regulator
MMRIANGPYPGGQVSCRAQGLDRLHDDADIGGDMSMNARRPELGRLESTVLAVVAASGEALTVSQVQAQLPADPAYTTVMSTLARLAQKGALRRIRDGRAYRYELAAPAASIDDALTARQMRRLLGDGGDHAAVLARFVAELDEDDERLLTDLLGRGRRPGSDGPR